MNSDLIKSLLNAPQIVFTVPDTLILPEISDFYSGINNTCVPQSSSEEKENLPIDQESVIILKKAASIHNSSSGCKSNSYKKLPSEEFPFRSESSSLESPSTTTSSEARFSSTLSALAIFAQAFMPQLF